MTSQTHQCFEEIKLPDITPIPYTECITEHKLFIILHIRRFQQKENPVSETSQTGTK